MSLIQDALKRKREEEVVSPPQETPPSTPPVTAPESPIQKNKPKHTPTKLPLILIAVILLILISLGTVKLLRNVPPAAAPKPTPQQPLEKVDPPTPVAKRVEKTTKNEWPKLKLTGFASGGGQQMIFINGKMLSEGREIDGAHIIQIGETEVLVDYQGERRILRIDD